MKLFFKFKIKWTTSSLIIFNAEVILFTNVGQEVDGTMINLCNISKQFCNKDRIELTYMSFVMWGVKISTINFDLRCVTSIWQ